MPLAPLPIDSLLPELTQTLRREGCLVLEAEPGAGKTTRMPRALLDEGLLYEGLPDEIDAGDVWILEPRRLAARLAALRVAEELGEEIGQRVGYAVRFESKVSRHTRIRFVTEALLLRRLLTDPELVGTSTVILDEFHERSLHTDLALSLLVRLRARRLSTGRPDLRILVMSATLDADPIAAFLGAPRLRCEGRPHPVEIRHDARPDDRPVSIRVREALEGLPLQHANHILVFLPGAAEIRSCQREVKDLAERRGWKILPLHGSLSLDAQREALAPCEVTKVILSTNVAESSVTLEGVRTVIDTGLGREAFHSPWSGLASLRTRRISQSRCIQRAGRAGRQGPGLCLRLYTEADFTTRPSFDEPEIRRTDLAEAILSLHAMGLDPRKLSWFETPPHAHLDAAEDLLARLGALDEKGQITRLGRAMMEWPVHPRLARLIAAGQELGIPRLAKLAAALLEAGDLEARITLERGNRSEGPLESDLWPRLDAYHEVAAAHFSAAACRIAGLDLGAVLRVKQVVRAMEMLSGQAPGHAATVDVEGSEAESRLRQALLLAYPDRVARRTGGATFTLCGGTGARLDSRSRVTRSDLVVALEASEMAKGAGKEIVLGAVSAIEPEWLLEHFPEHIRETKELAFNPANGRVEIREGLWYEDLCLDETRKGADPSDHNVSRILAKAVMERGLGESREKVDRFLDRIHFLSRWRTDLGLPDRDTLQNDLVTRACQGLNSLKDLESVDWSWILREWLGLERLKILDAWAPDSIQLPKRRVPVNYERESPWIASRLQDFLGMKEGPRIAGGTLPLVLHLLAPNQRPVQVTTDLAGFWQRAYRELRPSLCRRYPKHAWPENPYST